MPDEVHDTDDAQFTGLEGRLRRIEAAGRERWKKLRDLEKLVDELGSRSEDAKNRLDMAEGFCTGLRAANEQISEQMQALAKSLSDYLPYVKLEVPSQLRAELEPLMEKAFSDEVLDRAVDRVVAERPEAQVQLQQARELLFDVYTAQLGHAGVRAEMKRKIRMFIMETGG